MDGANQGTEQGVNVPKELGVNEQELERITDKINTYEQQQRNVKVDLDEYANVIKNADLKAHQLRNDIVAQIDQMTMRFKNAKTTGNVPHERLVEMSQKIKQLHASLHTLKGSDSRIAKIRRSVGNLNGHLDKICKQQNIVISQIDKLTQQEVMLSSQDSELTDAEIASIKHQLKKIRKLRSSLERKMDVLTKKFNHTEHKLKNNFSRFYQYKDHIENLFNQGSSQGSETSLVPAENGNTYDDQHEQYEASPNYDDQNAYEGHYEDGYDPDRPDQSDVYGDYYDQEVADEYDENPSGNDQENAKVINRRPVTTDELTFLKKFGAHNVGPNDVPAQHKLAELNVNHTKPVRNFGQGKKPLMPLKKNNPSLISSLTQQIDMLKKPYTQTFNPSHSTSNTYVHSLSIPRPLSNGLVSQVTETIQNAAGEHPSSVDNSKINLNHSNTTRITSASDNMNSLLNRRIRERIQHDTGMAKNSNNYYGNRTNSFLSNDEFSTPLLYDTPTMLNDDYDVNFAPNYLNSMRPDFLRDNSSSLLPSYDSVYQSGRSSFPASSSANGYASNNYSDNYGINSQSSTANIQTAGLEKNILKILSERITTCKNVLTRYSSDDEVIQRFTNELDEVALFFENSIEEMHKKLAAVIFFKSDVSKVCPNEGEDKVLIDSSYEVTSQQKQIQRRYDEFLKFLGKFKYRLDVFSGKMFSELSVFSAFSSDLEKVYTWAKLYCNDYPPSFYGIFNNLMESCISINSRYTQLWKSFNQIDSFLTENNSRIDNRVNDLNLKSQQIAKRTTYITQENNAFTKLWNELMTQTTELSKKINDIFSSFLQQISDMSSVLDGTTKNIYENQDFKFAADDIGDSLDFFYSIKNAFEGHVKETAHSFNTVKSNYDSFLAKRSTMMNMENENYIAIEEIKNNQNILFDWVRGYCVKLDENLISLHAFLYKIAVNQRQMFSIYNNLANKFRVIRKFILTLRDEKTKNLQTNILFGNTKIDDFPVFTDDGSSPFDKLDMKLPEKEKNNDTEWIKREQTKFNDDKVIDELREKNDLLFNILKERQKEDDVVS